MRTDRSRSTTGAAAFTLMAAALLFTGGCDNAGQGAVSGASVGALSGLAIGSLSGNAGKGAAIGAVAGGVGGAVIGDQNRRSAQANRTTPTPAPAPTPTPAPAPAPPPAASAYQTGAPLSALVGQWTVQGTVVSAGSQFTTTGTATAVADKNFFLRIDLSLRDPRINQDVQGTSVISQRGGRSVEMTNSFSSSPEIERFQGEMDASGTVFSFREINPASASPRRIVIRVLNDGQWTADVWDRSGGPEIRTESLTFSPRR